MAFKKGETSKEKNNRWKGGVKIHAHGYRLIASPDHPFKDKQGYVREHRLVMEGYLGRYLKPEELVHHRNHIKTDNRIENLELTTRTKHKIEHHPEIGQATRFKKGCQTPNPKNGMEIPCIICGTRFYVAKSLFKKRKTCGNRDCKLISVSRSMKAYRAGIINTI